MEYLNALQTRPKGNPFGMNQLSYEFGLPTNQFGNVTAVDEIVSEFNMYQYMNFGIRERF